MEQLLHPIVERIGHVLVGFVGADARALGSGLLILLVRLFQVVVGLLSRDLGNFFSPSGMSSSSDGTTEGLVLPASLASRAGLQQAKLLEIL